MSVRQLASLAAFAVSCLVLFSSISVAQETKPFRVDSYIPEKFTDLEWRLDGRFDANGTSSDNDYSYISSPALNFRKEEESRNQLRLSGGSTLRYTYLTQPRFFNCLVSFEPSWNRDANISEDRAQSDDPVTHYSHNNTTKSELDAYALSGTIRVSAGQYFANDLFLQAGASSSASYQSTYHNVNDESGYRSYHEIADNTIYRFTEFQYVESESDRKHYRVTGELSVGWGRMHVGEYAATALMIAEVLRENGLLDEQPSHEQMTKLTQRIYDLRRQHSIDDRLRRIEALQEIIGYLQSERLVGSLNARQCLLIQDVWDYYPRSKRMFGTQMQVGCGSYYNLTSQQSGTSWREGRLNTREYLDSAGVVDTSLNEFLSGYQYNHSKSDADQSYLYFKVDYWKPLNTHWQFGAWGFGRYYLNEDNSESPILAAGTEMLSPAFSDAVNSTNPTYSDHYAIEGNANLEWLVDSRTSLSFGGSLSYSNIFMEQTYQYYDSYDDSLVTGTNTRNESLRRLGVSSIFNYRISIPTTLTLNLTLLSQRRVYRYNSTHETVDSYWNYRVSVGLQHYLF